MRTAEAIAAIAPKARAEFVRGFAATLDDMAPMAGLASITAMSGFLAHCHHESMGFTRFEENMRYSARRLVQVWPRRFPTIEAAQPYAMQPEKLAAYVYANRMGNGAPQTGDGWKYRGSGAFQHTGRAEAERVYAATGVTFEQLRNPANGAANARAAISYCVDRNVVDALRIGDMTLSTRRINGGLNGLQDRIILQRRYAAALAGQTRPAERTRAETVDRNRKAAGGALAGGAASGGGATIAIPEAPATDHGTAVAWLIGGGIALGLMIIGVVLWKRAAKLTAVLRQEQAQKVRALTGDEA